jgi:hypothetical protein
MRVDADVRSVRRGRDMECGEEEKKRGREMGRRDGMG